MLKTVCIDWLSFTGHGKVNQTYPLLPPWESGLSQRPDTPRFGYRQAVKFNSGAVIMFDGATPSMGWHYIYSGSALKLLDQQFEDGGETVLKWHEAQGHKCTRIDLAIDVFEDPALLHILKIKAEKHEWTGTAHSCTTVQSSDGKGLTIYVGSRSSERFVRMYDKAAQMAQEGDWTRIECEVKGDSARAVSRAIIAVGEGGIGIVAQSVIARVCSFDDHGWKAIFDGERMAIGTPKVEEKKTEEWLLGQVASALASFELNYPDKRILDRFWAAVEDKLGEIREQSQSE